MDDKPFVCAPLITADLDFVAPALKPPRYPPPKFRVPIERALYSETVQPDGTRRLSYTVNGHEVPEEIFAAAVAELGSQWPSPGPAFPSTTGRVCLFRRGPGPICLQGTHIIYRDTRPPLDKE